MVFGFWVVREVGGFVASRKLRIFWGWLCSEFVWGMLLILEMFERFGQGRYFRLRVAG